MSLHLRYVKNEDSGLIDFYLLEKDNGGNIVGRAKPVEFGKMRDLSYHWDGRPTFSLDIDRYREFADFMDRSEYIRDKGSREGKKAKIVREGKAKIVCTNIAWLLLSKIWGFFFK